MAAETRSDLEAGRSENRKGPGLIHRLRESGVDPGDCGPKYTLIAVHFKNSLDQH